MCQMRPGAATGASNELCPSRSRGQLATDLRTLELHKAAKTKSQNSPESDGGPKPGVLGPPCNREGGPQSPLPGAPVSLPQKLARTPFP